MPTYVFRKQLIFLCLIGTILFAMISCSKSSALPKPDGAFPDSVGKYNLNKVNDGKQGWYRNEKNKGQEFQVWESTYSDNEKEIIYSVSVHKTAEDAVNEVEFLTGCYSTIGSTRELSTGNKIWGKTLLKDKSGKDAGTLVGCFAKPNDYVTDAFGHYNYNFSFSRDNRTFSVKSSPWNNAGAITEFIKALPFNSQLDLSILDQFSSANAEKPLKYDEIFNEVSPVKLTAKPYLKGNVLVLEQKPIDDDERSISRSDVTSFYIKDDSRRAMFPWDIGSIVRVDCKKGKQLGDYKVGGTAIPAFGSLCEVSITDQKIPAIIAKRTFVDNELAEINILDADKKGNVRNKQYLTPFPIHEIKKFIESLPGN